jgi:hypothetical protein
MKNITYIQHQFYRTDKNDILLEYQLDFICKRSTDAGWLVSYNLLDCHFHAGFDDK